MAKNGVSNMLMGLRKKGKLAKPALVINATMRTPYPGEKSPDAYEVIRAHQVSDQIDAIREQLDNWDDAEVVKQAKKSMQAELKSCQADLMACRARLGLDDKEPLPKLPKKKASAMDGAGMIGY